MQASCWCISRLCTLLCLRTACMWGYHVPILLFHKYIDLCRRQSYESVYGGGHRFWLISKQPQGNALGGQSARWGVSKIGLRSSVGGGFGESVTTASMLFLTEASVTLILAVDLLLRSLPRRWLMSETRKFKPALWKGAFLKESSPPEASSRLDLFVFTLQASWTKSSRRWTIWKQMRREFLCTQLGHFAPLVQHSAFVSSWGLEKNKTFDLWRGKDAYC